MVPTVAKKSERLRELSLSVRAINIIDQLPRRRPYIPGQSTGHIEGLAYHHQAGEGTALTIARWHVEQQPKPWDHIGYTFVIEDNGLIEQTLHFDELFFHAGYTDPDNNPSTGDDLSKFPNRDPQYYNKHYLAACLTGDLSKRKATEGQMAASIALGVAVRRATAGIGKLLGHGELPGKSTTCPASLNVGYIRGQVERIVSAAPSIPNVGPALPLDHPDSFWHQFPTWYDATVRMKGVADVFGKELERSRDVLKAVLDQNKVLLKAVEAQVAQINKVAGEKG